MFATAGQRSSRREPRAAVQQEAAALRNKGFAAPAVTCQPSWSTRLAVLWAGTLLTAFGLASMFVMQSLSSISVDEVYQRDDAARMATESLVIILASIQGFACGTALMAYYSNRRAMRWSLTDANEEPDPW